jgi:hypothetical protein
LQLLAAHQLTIIDKHFGGDDDFLQRAFEDFRHCILYDGRRPLNDRVHCMDFSPDADGRGTLSFYHAWYGFARTTELTAAGDPARWQAIGKFIGFAWGIQTEANPRINRPNAPALSAARIQILRDF